MHRVFPGIGGLKELAQGQPGHRTQGHTQYDGDRDVHKIHHIGMAALCHTGKGGKQHDDKDIIAGSPRQDHLRDALFHAVVLFHQLHHARDDHRRGDRTQHSTHHGRFHPGNAQNGRRKQEKCQNLAAGRHTGHHHRRAAHLFQVRQVERKPRLDEDDDECHLPQLRRDGQNGSIQPVEGIRSQQDAGEARQPQLLAHRRHGKPDEKNKRKRCQHGSSVSSQKGKQKS